MKPQESAPQRGGEPGPAFAVIAHLDMDAGYQVASGPKILRIVSREEGADPASHRAARNPGGGPV